MISRFLICFISSWASLSGIPKQRLWKKTTSSTHVSVEKSMPRNSLWCEIRYSLDVFHLKKIQWKRPFNVVTLFCLARRARPRHLQPHPNSERQIALNDNESLPSYGKVNFPKILPPTTPHLWNPGTNLIHRSHHSIKKHTRMISNNSATSCSYYPRNTIRRAVL